MMGTNILYVARGGPISGSQRQLLNLIRRMDRKKYVPLVVCSEGGGFADCLAEMGIATHVYPVLFGWRKARHVVHRYQLVAALWRQLSGRDIGLIHCSYQWYAPYCRYLSRRLKCPYLVHIRGPVDRSAVRKYGFVEADRLIAISPRSGRNLVDAGIEPEKVSIVYDSVDTNVFRPVPRGSGGFNGTGDFVFGLAGRIAPDKHQLAFVRAARIVASRHSNVRFVLVGQACDREYSQEVEKQIKEFDLSDRVILYGRSEQMPNVLSDCDVLVSLSGGSIMYEALACGVPVLSAGYTRKEDSVHVIHDHNAMLVESREPEDVACAMERLLVDGCYTSRLAANTRAHILDHLNDGIMAAQTQAVYESLLKGGGPGAGKGNQTGGQ
ncbi:MAG: glycosyltransferase family 4 protein [Phycisphaerae bacterium]|nr:glycosyltransferase family 4 protein [Phycisphaerae bacterium]